MTMLTTGEAATQLGVSRQQVVNLCERGTLTFVRVGAHRRIADDEIERFLGSRQPDPSHLLLLWLSRATAAHVAADPAGSFTEARRRLAWQTAREPHGARLIRAWRKRMKEGPEAVMRTLTGTDHESVTLQSISPFRFLLGEAERDRIVTAFNAWWAARERGHAHAPRGL
jgi:excisionase family DNA binding protein